MLRLGDERCPSLRAHCDALPAKGCKNADGSITGDQVIRENPASRGTEASAEVLVGPPLVAGGLLNAGQQQWY